MARVLQQDPGQDVPGRREVEAMFKVCKGLNEQFRALIKANHVSWRIGHDEPSR